MRICRQEIVRTAIQIGEVTAASAGNEDLLADAIGVFEHSDATSALASREGTHQAGRASAKNDRVKIAGHLDSVMGRLVGGK